MVYNPCDKTSSICQRSHWPSTLLACSLTVIAIATTIFAILAYKLQWGTLPLFALSTTAEISGVFALGIFIIKGCLVFKKKENISKAPIQAKVSIPLPNPQLQSTALVLNIYQAIRNFSSAQPLRLISQLPPTEAKNIFFEYTFSISKDDPLDQNFIDPSTMQTRKLHLFEYVLYLEEPKRTSLTSAILNQLEKSSLTIQNLPLLIPKIFEIKKPPLISQILEKSNAETQKCIYENSLKHNIIDWIKGCIEKKMNQTILTEMTIEDFIFALFVHSKDHVTILCVLTTLKNDYSFDFSTLLFKKALPVYPGSPSVMCSVSLLILAMVQTKKPDLIDQILVVEPKLFTINGSIQENGGISSFSPFFWSIELDRRELIEFFLKKFPALKEKKEDILLCFGGKQESQTFSPFEFADERLAQCAKHVLTKDISPLD